MSTLAVILSAGRYGLVRGIWWSGTPVRLRERSLKWSLVYTGLRPGVWWSPGRVRRCRAVAQLAALFAIYSSFSGYSSCGPVMTPPHLEYTQKKWVYRRKKSGYQSAAPAPAGTVTRVLPA
jgi:hypothetical protein